MHFIKCLYKLFAEQHTKLSTVPILTVCTQVSTCQCMCLKLRGVKIYHAWQVVMQAMKAEQLAVLLEAGPETFVFITVQADVGMSFMTRTPMASCEG